MAAKRAVGIVTDTTASLPAGFAAAHHIPVVPQVIVFGERTYLEEREISYGQFISQLRTASELPKTQAPPPGEFVSVFGQELARAESLICIHPSSDVSGTVRSAMTARESAFPQADIRIIDTRTIAAGLGAIVRAATAWAESGLTADEVEARIREMMARNRTYFLVSTLEYLRRGGRIGTASALAGSVLRVKPILEFVDGHVAPLEKVRTQERALGRLLDLVVEHCPRSAESYLWVMHADAQVEAEQFAERLRARLGIEEIPLLGVGAAITTHAGPGVLGVSFFES
ncbi:MAG: DegV family protein [Anaerolineae bacterium]|nr:DegV family protein [Anaerolineae bacterium]